MKAITLYQPWASLIAVGAKRIETRPWFTHYRGELAIHAGKTTPAWVWDLMSDKEFDAALTVAFPGVLERDLSGRISVGQFPTGVIVATCTLVDCVPVNLVPVLTNGERMFGDYSPGRFAWMLEDIKPLAEPIPATGKQGLWEWNAGVQDGE